MRLNIAALCLLLAASNTHAFVPSRNRHSICSLKPFTSPKYLSVSSSAANVESSTEEESFTDSSSSALDYVAINNLKFRELQKECKERGLAAVGSTAVLRNRLMEHEGIAVNGGQDVDVVAERNDEGITNAPAGIAFQDQSDPNFEFNSLQSEIVSKASVGHWKAATRKLKQLGKKHSTQQPIPPETYLTVLEACATNKLHGARASEPARKILEEMSENGYDIPAKLANGCVQSSIGLGPNGSHDGFGGIDTALAMLSAIERSNSKEVLTLDTYGAVVTALSKDESIEEALLLLRAMVVEHSFTPLLSTFADAATAAAKTGRNAEQVLQVLSLTKAAGYVLDNIASAQAGREILAAGVIAAEQLDNLPLGLRLLTAAQKAEGCLPDRGDDLVASASAAAQRACTLIHRRAIDKAVEDQNWKLAVKLLELMQERGLRPSASVWRKVVTVCAKCEKSKKATAILMDWVKLSEQQKADKPPVAVFNSVVNVCEICGEEELTLMVLESMKRTHNTEGNIITMNIALKRLAKSGQTRACEGMIVGMLQAGIEPTVVSYTTAIGACAKEGQQDSALAYEWLQRMRSRNVMPNFHTYNTALATCLDGKLESTVRGSKIATLMLDDIDQELAMGLKGSAEYKSVIPDTYTKTLARLLMKQLRENWRTGEINMKVAKATIRVPLLKLVDFNKSEAAERVRNQITEAKEKKSGEEAEEESIEKEEAEVEYAAVNELHKTGRRRIEV